MQVIKHSTTLIHPLLKEIEYFYTLTSDKSLKCGGKPLVEYLYNSRFKKLQYLFKRYGYITSIKTVKKKYKTINLPKNGDNKIIVCFSGGKDSLATALYYKNEGYTVYLYHLKGINKCYPKEYERAQKLAELLDMPYIEDTITLSGNHCYTEHPMKNMIIANMALSWGIGNNITSKIAFGNYYTSTLENDPFEVCGGDCKEMWEVYEYLIRSIIPKFKIYTPLSNIEDSMKCLIDNPKYLPYISSCIGTHRFTGYYRKQNESKYHITLLPHRCGSCWKCAYEYVYLCDHNVLQYNRGYYNHCITVLRNTIKKEQGRKVDKEQAFLTYFFYDIQQSHIGE